MMGRREGSDRSPHIKEQSGNKDIVLGRQGRICERGRKL